MKKLLALTLVLVSANSFALTSSLTFQVSSSGADAFPCNAGIRHLTHTTRDGYNQDGTRCVGTECCVGINCQPGMSTTTGTRSEITSAGTWLPEIMKAKMAYWSAANGWETAASTSLKAEVTSGFKSLITVGADFGSSVLDAHRAYKDGIRRNNVLFDLSFLFASEHFGAEYFVDMCNYFPENYCGSGNCGINSNDMGVNPGSTWSNLVAFYSGTNESVLKYIDLSGLKVSVKTFCDGVEKNTFADQLVSGTFANLNMASLGAVPPRKCVTRFTFTEKLVNKMRPNQTQTGCFHVGTEVNESGTDVTSVGF